MANGFLIIFEPNERWLDERHLSAKVYSTRADADVAWQRGNQVGRPLDIIQIEWDDTRAKEPWPSSAVPRRTIRTWCLMLGLTVLLLAGLAFSLGAVAKLENSRYANFLGLCTDGYDLKNPASRSLARTV